MIDQRRPGFDMSFLMVIALMGVLLFWWMMLVALSSCKRDPNLKDQDYVRAIVGEAANQSEETMACIAHALRNRGNLKGVYGLNADHVRSENYSTWHKAWVAWEISGQEEDPTHGSKNFGTISDLNYTFTTTGRDSFTVPYKHRSGDFYFY